MGSGMSQPETAADRKALEKRGLSEREAETLLDARGADAARLRSMARFMTRKTVTMSLNVSVPVTRLCRNMCAYCGFRKSRGGYLRWSEILPVLLKAQELGCCEALYMAGEKPELVHRKARDFLRREGFSSTPEYVWWLCANTLDKTDLLPHTNIGVLEPEELRLLKDVNASMGLMLEDASSRLCAQGMPHERSPGKDPEARLRMIEDAGRLRIPFTSGLLIGIGQSRGEIAHSLERLKGAQTRYGHLQELIIQRFVPGEGTGMAGFLPPPDDLMLNTFAVARLVMGRTISLQVPPNIEPNFEAFLLAGADDLGAVSPLTPDYINPRLGFSSRKEIFKRISSIGLRARLRPPVYPRYATSRYLSPRLLSRTKLWIDRMRNMPWEDSPC